MSMALRRLEECRSGVLGSSCCVSKGQECATLLTCSALPASPHSHLNPKWVQEQLQSTLLDLGEREKDFFSFSYDEEPSGQGLGKSYTG